MILHPDGRVEGTPEEVAAYKREFYPIQKIGSIEDHTELKKPPLGLLPKWLWDENRLAEIEAAIQRFKDAGMTVPLAFTDEAFKLRQSISPSKSNSQSF